MEYCDVGRAEQAFMGEKRCISLFQKKKIFKIRLQVAAFEAFLGCVDLSHIYGFSDSYL